MTQKTTGDLEDDEDEDDAGGFSAESHRKKRKGRFQEAVSLPACSDDTESRLVAIMPSVGK